MRLHNASYLLSPGHDLVSTVCLVDYEIETHLQKDDCLINWEAQERPICLVLESVSGMYVLPALLVENLHVNTIKCSKIFAKFSIDVLLI